MIVLVLTAIGVGSALFNRRRIRRFAELRLEGLWMVWLAIVTQILIFEVIGYFIPVWVTEVLHLATYALCIAFMYRNRHLPGGWIIMVGTAANLAAITANGGTMPASATAWERAGLRQPTDFENSSTATDGHLAFLGDVFYIPEGWPLANVFSIGDVLIVVGGTYLAHRWCRRAPSAALSPTSDADGFAAPAAWPTEPVPADLEQLAGAVNELRETLKVRLDAVAADAAAARSEASVLHDEARADVLRTRDTLVTLIAEIQGSVGPERPASRSQPAADTSDTAGSGRMDELERRVADQQQALDRALDRQRELADLLAAVLDASSAQV